MADHFISFFVYFYVLVKHFVIVYEKRDTNKYYYYPLQVLCVKYLVEDHALYNYLFIYSFISLCVCFFHFLIRLIITHYFFLE